VDSAPDLDIRGHLTGLLAGDESLDAFRRWFAASIWCIEQLADDETAELAFAVENRLAEYSSGYITETQLKHALLPLLEHHPVVPG